MGTDLCRNPTLQQTPESSIPSLECQTYSSQISLHLHHRVTCNILSLGHWQVPISQSFSVKNVIFPSNYERKWYFHWDMRHIHSLKKWSEAWIGRRSSFEQRYHSSADLSRASIHHLSDPEWNFFYIWRTLISIEPHNEALLSKVTDLKSFHLGYLIFKICLYSQKLRAWSLFKGPSQF